MKKKLVLLLMMTSVMGLTFTGCENGDDKEKQAVESSVATEESVEATIEDTTVTEVENTDTTSLNTEGSIRDLNYEEYITLGDYKGIEITVDPIEVTDEEVMDSIESALSYALAEEVLVEEGTVADGDTIRIDYVGYIDGEPFENGADEGYDLVIGSNSFIEGFESSLIGAKVGEKKTIDVTFPDDYGAADLAGKKAQFEVMVHAIVTSKVPELTDGNAADVAGALGVEATDIESLKAAVKDSLYESKMEASKEEVSALVQEAVYANMTVLQTPEFLKNRLYTRLDSNYAYYASMYGTDAATFLYYMNGSDPSDYESIVMGQAVDYANQYIGYQMIAEAEGIDVTDEEAQAEVDALYIQYGYQSAEEFLSYIPLDEYRDDMMFEKVLNFLVENAVVNYATAE